MPSPLFAQPGLARDVRDALFECRPVTGAEDAPWRQIWRAQNDGRESVTLRLVPDLSVHLVFDVSGLVDVEPFLLQTGLAHVDLVLPAGVELIGVQLPVWDGLPLRDAALDEPVFAVRFDAQWVDWIYYMLLEARNAGRDAFDALASDRAFGEITHDAAIRQDLRQHFVQVAHATAEDAALAYSDRQQRRLYRELTGLSPAQFNRVLRFQNSLQTLLTTGTAGMDGYFDAAHCAKDYKALCGLSPRQMALRYAHPSSLATKRK
jgi:hypothetical protein